MVVHNQVKVCWLIKGKGAIHNPPSIVVGASDPCISLLDPSVAVKYVF